MFICWETLKKTFNLASYMRHYFGSSHSPSQQTAVMCTKGICSRVSIDTLNQYPKLASRSIPDGHFDWYSVDTRSTLDQQSVDSWLSVDRLIWNYPKLVDSQHWLRCRWSVNQGVDGVSMEYWLRVDQGYWSAYERRCCTHDPMLLHYW